jgi:D-sedoheptulose 7-phosphate isomerase
MVEVHIKESIEVHNKILHDRNILKQIELVSTICTEVYKNQKKILLAGNGGSAADAQHIAAEFVSKFNLNRPGLPSIALTTNTSILTSIGNDYGFERIFARQIEAYGEKGDLFFAISTSGNSVNIVEALKIAKVRGLICIGLSGENGGEMETFCDYCLKVPSILTPRIQEAHILIGHIICSIVEENLFGNK